MADYDDLDNTKIFVAGAASVVLTILTILGVQTCYYALEGISEQRKLGQTEYFEANQHLAKQRDEINSYGVDDQTAGLRIPISDAMKKVIEESKQSEDESDA